MYAAVQLIDQRMARRLAMPCAFASAFPTHAEASSTRTSPNLANLSTR